MSAVRLALAALAATLLLPALAPAPASAGSYTVWSCRGPAGEPLTGAAWVPYGTATSPGSRVDSCATGGALTVALTAASADRQPGAETGFRLLLPQTVTPLRYRVEMAARATSASMPPTHYDLGLGVGSESLDAGVGTECTTLTSDCTFGTFAEPLAPANVVTDTLAPGDVLRFKAICHSTMPCTPGAGDPPVLGQLFRAAVELDDPAAPQVGAVSGSIAAAGAVGGVRSVVADATDVGGGVHRTELLVDGAVRDARDGTGRCASPYTAAQPCPDAGRAAFDLDTRQLADGPHTVVVRAIDAGGNASESAPLSVMVDNRPPAPVVVTVPGPPQAPAGGAPPSLDGARLVLPTRRSATAGTRVSGTLLGADGGPRAGVSVRFERRPFGGDADDWEPIGTPAVTGADGRFRLPVVRESGEVRAVAGSAETATTVAFVAPLKVRARAADRTLRNGSRFTLNATVSGDGGAFAGREALVQSRVEGRWRTVDSARVAASGKVRWTYRFTSTRRTARYRFRIVLAKVPRLPWSQVRSGVVTVLVRGR